MSNDDPLRGWTPDQVRALAQAFPGDVATAEDGTLIPKLSRGEFDALVARYPSCFPRRPPAPAATSPEEAQLRARYPSMY
jgi:hypothetical protein